MSDRKQKPDPTERETTRRTFVAGAMGGAVALLSGCAREQSRAGGSGGGSSACTVYPQQTEGPFYVDLDLVRSDITEGKPGTPLALTVVVQRASDCAPLAGVAIDVWHCDADGVYSGYPGQLGGLDTTGQKFLRGTQVADADGRAVFQTIYPGWYPGRTTHIHFKVHPSKTAEATSQLYFPEDANSAVYSSGVYAARGQKDTTNLGDGVNGGSVPPLLTLEKTKAGYAATLNVTVAS